MNNELQWLDLPIRGAVVQRLAFSGNGKDSTVSIDTVGHPIVVIPSGDVSLTFGADMGTQSRALDDLDIEIQVTWPPGKVVVLERAQVEWELSMERWANELESLKQLKRRWELSALVSLRLGLAYQ